MGKVGFRTACIFAGTLVPRTHSDIQGPRLWYQQDKFPSEPLRNCLVTREILMVFGLSIVLYHLSSSSDNNSNKMAMA